MHMLKFLVVRRRRRRQKQFRSIWVRRWLSAERRLQYGQHDRLMAELRMETLHSFFNFLRMQPEMFDELRNRVAQRIQKNDTSWRKSLEPGLKLAITLRHLAGDKYPTLHFGFRLSFQSCAKQLLRNIRMKLLLALLPQMNDGV